MGAAMFGIKLRERRYIKPNMCLKGRLGRRVYEEMLHAPKPDFTQLDKEIAEEKARILAMRKNGMDE